MAEFVGKYKLISSENFDQFLKKLGVGLVSRNVASNSSSVQDVEVNGDDYHIKTTTTFKNTELKFKLGEEFTETTADGREVKTVITRDGNKLIQDQKGEKPTTIIRTFEGDTMTIVITLGDVVSTRVYKKE